MIIGFDAAGGWETPIICIPITVKKSDIGRAQNSKLENCKQVNPIREAKTWPPKRFLTFENSDFGTANNKKIEAPKEPIINWWPENKEIIIKSMIAAAEAIPLNSMVLCESGSRKSFIKLKSFQTKVLL